MITLVACEPGYQAASAAELVKSGVCTGTASWQHAFHMGIAV